MTAFTRILVGAALTAGVTGCMNLDAPTQCAAGACDASTDAVDSTTDLGGDVTPDTVVADSDAAADTAEVDAGKCKTAPECTAGATETGTGTCTVWSEEQRRTCSADCAWSAYTCEPRKGWQAASATPSSFVGRALHSMVWSGTEVLIWGGAADQTRATLFDTGIRYNPSTNTWTAMAKPPTGFVPRYGHSAIWTGTQMIVFGGTGAAGARTGDGAIYTPATDSWKALPTPPFSKRDAPAVWVATAKKMVVWGGVDSTGYLADGAAYDPVLEAWSSIPASVIGARESHTAVDVGGAMAVFGGADSGGLLKDGALYDPVGKKWTALPAAPGAFVPRFFADSSATSDGFLTFGGQTSLSPAVTIGDGLRLSGTTWSLVSTPADTILADPRRFATAHWCSPTSCFVWGGTTGTAFLGNGAVLDLAKGTWSSMPTAGAPGARAGAVVAWIGKSAFMWGGSLSVTTSTSDGYLFTP